MTNVVKLRDGDVYRGYVPCGCGKYAHILTTDGLRAWPDGYTGELCQECGCRMADLSKRKPDAFDAMVEAINKMEPSAAMKCGQHREQKEEA